MSEISNLETKKHVILALKFLQTKLTMLKGKIFAYKIPAVLAKKRQNRGYYSFISPVCYKQKD